MKSLTLYGSGTITIYGHDWRVFPVKASMPFKTCYRWPYCDDDDFIKVMREEEAGFARGRGVASGEIQAKTMHNKEGRMGGKKKKSDWGRRIERGIERRDRKKKVVA